MGRILKKGRNCWEIKRVKKSGVLIDGREYYRAFYRAALRAERYILISGWQFDSTVALLRGEDAREATAGTGLLEFLNTLCLKNPALKVYILAWDFSLLFALEREWMQEWVFNWATSERLFFHFDHKHAAGISLHRKYSVIDGYSGFVGGIDICAGRWDDSLHAPGNPHRVDGGGSSYGPYHDIQAYMTGRAAKKLTELFRGRWEEATGVRLKLPGPRKADHIPHGSGIPISARAVGLSRTQAHTLVTPEESIREIRSLYIDAISSADRLIYIENQYLSSSAVCKALKDRMEERGRPALGVVIILPERPQAFLDEISMRVTQSGLLRLLKDVSERTGNPLGVYYPVRRAYDGRDVPVYVHSKVLLVDDRLLMIGSANTTNRSMGLDTELNAVWEAGYRKRMRTMRSILNVRVNLLSEHTGIPVEDERGRLSEPGGLVDRLNGIAGDPASNLRVHSLEGASFTENPWLRKIFGDYLFDPETAIVDENIFETASGRMNSLFADGITILKKWLEEKGKGFI